MDRSGGYNGSFPGGGGGGGDATPAAPAARARNGEIIVTYTPVYSGNVSWSASGGGSWGTLTSNFGTNWGGAGYGSPGLNPSFPDTATLGSSVASGTATVTLDGASPSLAALTFSNSAASYTIAAGSGGTLHLNGGTAAAALTDSAGSHAISAPVALDTSAIVAVTNPGDTLTISGPIGGSGGLTTSRRGHARPDRQQLLHRRHDDLRRHARPGERGHDRQRRWAASRTTRRSCLTSQATSPSPTASAARGTSW